MRRLTRPPGWLWLLAWVMTVLVFRAVVFTQTYEPPKVRTNTSSPFDERWGGDFNTSAIPLSPDPRG